jgi:long-chain acyl-CoA synthetase
LATRSALRKQAANPTPVREGTLVELFFSAIDRYHLPNAQLYRTAEGWQSISHDELLDRVRSFAAGLEQLGVRRGDRVGLLSENRPEWPLTDYALLCLGALNVPLYGTLPPPQIEFILRDAGARGVVVSNADQLAKIQEIADQLPDLQFIILFDGTGSGRVKTLSEVLAAGARVRPDEATFRERALQASPSDLATLIYTSGTTGQPKGVMLTHNNLFSNVMANTWLGAGNGKEVALSFLPLSHVFQRMVDYALFYLGVPLAYVSSFDDLPRALVEVKPTVVCAVPRVYEKLYAKIMSVTGPKRALVLWARRVALEWAEAVLAGRKPATGLRIQHAIADKLVYTKVRARLGGRIKFFVSGGAPLDPELARFFYGAGVLILEGYGLTETSPVTNVNQPDAMRIGTVGKPVASTELMIAEDGEVLVRGPQVMKGYFNNEQATREAIDPDGWFHTGDIGDIDEDGYLRITDRKKDLIVTAGGKKIAPQPIENEVKRSRFIGEALILGDRRPFPIMLIVPDFPVLEGWAAEQGIQWKQRSELVANPAVQAKLEQEALSRLGDLARFELPKKFVILDREFDIDRGEITVKLSIKRRTVENNFRDAIEGAYAGAKSPADGEHGG